MWAYITTLSSKPNGESPYAHRTSSLQCLILKNKKDTATDHQISEEHSSVKENKANRESNLKETNFAN